MLLCHFKFSFKKDKLNFRFIGTLIILIQSQSQQYIFFLKVSKISLHLYTCVIFTGNKHGSIGVKNLRMAYVLKKRRNCLVY